jgi:O-antigen/teichoic acid export membrane protein
MYSAGAALVGAGTRFLILMLLARMFPQAQVGQFAYVLFLVDIGFLLVTFGMNAVASRYLAEYAADLNRRASLFVWWYRRSRWVPFAAAAAVLLAAMASGLEVSLAAGAGIAFWAFAYAGQSLVLAAFVGLQRFDQVFAVTALGSAASIAAVMLAAWASLPLAGLYALMGVACIASVLLALKSFAPLWSAGRQAGAMHSFWAGTAGYSLNMWLTALLWALVWSRGELPVVHHWLGDVALAHYSVALSLMGGLMMAVMLGSAGFAVQVTRLWGEGRKPEAYALCRKVSEWQLAIAVVVASASILFGPEIIVLTFGHGYFDAVSVLTILACGLPSFAFIMQNHLIQIYTNARYTRSCAVAGVAFLFFAAIVLTKQLGVEGAALSRVGTMFLMVLANIFFLIASGATASIPKPRFFLLPAFPVVLLAAESQGQSPLSKVLIIVVVATLAWIMVATSSRKTNHG